MPRETRRRTLRFAARAIWIVLIALGVVIAAAVVVVLVNPPALAEQAKERALPALSRRIGRVVTAGEARATLLPRIGVRIQDVVVAGDVPGGPPLAKAGEIFVAPRLWPLLRSRGQDIRLRAVEVRDVEVVVLQGRETPRGPSPPPEPGGGEGVEEEDRQLQLERVAVERGRLRWIDEQGREVVVSGISAEARDIRPGHPGELDLSAAVGSDNRNLKARLTIDWPRVEGEASVDGLELARFAPFLPEAVTGGAVSVQARISTLPDGNYSLEGPVRVPELRLGNRSLRSELHLAAVVPRSRPSDFEARLERVSIRGEGVELGGSATLEGMERLRFALAGPRLEVGEQDERAPSRRPPPEMHVTGTLAVDRLAQGKFALADVKVRLELARGGILTLHEATGRAYGGSVTASGTRVDLRQPVRRWHLETKLDSVDLSQAMVAFHGTAPLQGRLSGALSLDGEGNGWDELRENASGQGTVALTGGELTTGDFSRQVVESLLGALAGAGKREAARTPEFTAGGAQLEDLRTSFRIEDGWMVLPRAIRLRAGFGEASVGGRIGLDRRLDLSGTVRLSPDLMASVTGGALRPAGGLEVPLAVSGTLSEPRVTLPPEAVVRSVLRSGVGGSVPESIQEQVEGLLDQLRGGASGRKAQPRGR